MEHPTISPRTDELRAALARGEVRLSFQPIVELAGGRVIALEALVRWERPELGTVRAVELIALAEEEGAILELGAWVLERACAEAAGWPAGAAPLPVHVNLSAAELADPALPGRVRQTLARTGLAPERLWLEVRAATAMADAERACLTLEFLRAIGVKIALDNLGTDLPPLRELTRLPADMLKIDRSTTCALTRRPRDRAVVAALVALARALGIGVVAAGVEDAATAGVLDGLGCGAAQGYHLMVPHPAELLGDLVTRRRARTP